MPKAIRMALASGRFGPAIDEKDQFENFQIPATNPHPWMENIRPYTFSPESIEMHRQLQSTAFLVFQKGILVGEEYWLEKDKFSVTNSFSMAKSFVATIVGYLLRKGLMDLEEDVGNSIPHLQKNNFPPLTILHLLGMSSGIGWDESPTAWSDNAHAYYGNDLGKVIRSVRRIKPPGELFEYRSMATQLLAEVVFEKTGKSVQAWMSETLWPFLQAECDAYWNLDRRDGRVKAFCCLYATARDFARLGQLYLNGGTWENRSYLTQDFITSATRPQPVHDPLLGHANDTYGLHWWVGAYQNLAFYYARGIRGQYIICVPHLELLIVRLGHKRQLVDQSGHPPDLWVWLAAASEHVSL